MANARNSIEGIIDEISAQTTPVLKNNPHLVRTYYKQKNKQKHQGVPNVDESVEDILADLDYVSNDTKQSPVTNVTKEAIEQKKLIKSIEIQDALHVLNQPKQGNKGSQSASLDQKIETAKVKRDALTALIPDWHTWEKGWQTDYIKIQEIARQISELPSTLINPQKLAQPSRWPQWASPIQSFFSNVTYTFSRWFSFIPKTKQKEQTLIVKKAEDFTQAIAGSEKEVIDLYREKIAYSSPESSEKLTQKFTLFVDKALAKQWWPKNPRDDIKTAMGVSLEDCCLFLPKKINKTLDIKGEKWITSVYPRLLLKTGADKRLAYESPALWQALSKVQRYKEMDEKVLSGKAWDYVLLPYSVLTNYAKMVEENNQLSSGFKRFLTEQITLALAFYKIKELHTELLKDIVAGFDTSDTAAKKQACWDTMKRLLRYDKDIYGQGENYITQKTRILASFSLNKLFAGEDRFVAPDHPEWKRAANINVLLSGDVPAALQDFQKFFKGPRGQTSKIIDHALTLANSAQLEELKKYETVLAKIESPVIRDMVKDEKGNIIKDKTGHPVVQETPMALFSNDSVAIRFPKTGDLLTRKLKGLIAESAHPDFKNWDELAFCVKTLYTWPGLYGREPKIVAHVYFEQLKTAITGALDKVAKGKLYKVNKDLLEQQCGLIQLITQKTADKNVIPPEWDLAHELTKPFQSIRDNQDLDENTTEAALTWINDLTKFVDTNEITDPDFKSYRILNSNTSSAEQILNRTTLLGLKRLSDVPNNTIKNKRGIFLEKIKQAILSSADPLAELEKLYGEETDLTALKADPSSQTASDDKAIKVLIGDICKNANSSLKVSKFSEAFLEKLTENLRKAHPSAARITVDINTAKDDDFNNMVDRAGRQTATLEQCAVAALHSRLLNKKPGLWKLLNTTGCLPTNQYCVSKPILTSNSIKVKSLPKKDDATDSAKKRLKSAAPNVTGIRSHKP